MYGAIIDIKFEVFKANFLTQPKITVRGRNFWPENSYFWKVWIFNFHWKKESRILDSNWQNSKLFYNTCLSGRHLECFFKEKCYEPKILIPCYVRSRGKKLCNMGYMKMFFLVTGQFTVLKWAKTRAIFSFWHLFLMVSTIWSKRPKIIL